MTTLRINKTSKLTRRKRINQSNMGPMTWCTSSLGFWTSYRNNKWFHQRDILLPKLNLFLCKPSILYRMLNKNNLALETRMKFKVNLLQVTMIKKTLRQRNFQTKIRNNQTHLKTKKVFKLSLREITSNVKVLWIEIKTFFRQWI